METKFTHFDEQGNAVMVDVSEKNPTSRTALAEGKIQVNREVMDAISVFRDATVSCFSAIWDA